VRRGDRTPSAVRSLINARPTTRRRGARFRSLTALSSFFYDPQSDCRGRRRSPAASPDAGEPPQGRVAAASTLSTGTGRRSLRVVEAMDSRQTHEDTPAPTRGPAQRNPADNLTQKDRIRGGRRSAESQTRDATGRFAGSIHRQRHQDGPPRPGASESPQQGAGQTETGGRDT